SARQPRFWQVRRNANRVICILQGQRELADTHVGSASRKVCPGQTRAGCNRAVEDRDGRLKFAYFQVATRLFDQAASLNSLYEAQKDHPAHGAYGGDAA